MKRILLFIVFLTASSWMMAQRTVTGTIVDNGGDPLIGANVIVQGTDVGTITDIDGNFSLSVPDGNNTLIVSYIGFSDKTVDITGLSSVSVTLDEGEILDELVVTAAGLKRNSRDVVYANQTVSGEDLLSSPNKNTLEALRGKTAGVQLSTGSGSVGASTRIVLRGPGSLTGDNNALIVVDGIPIDNSAVAAGAGRSTTGYADHGNRFNDINPDDIESVTILKGPSATSLYGSRGASGVVLITTKKGGEGGTNFKVNLNSSFSQEKAYVLLQRQDQFGQGYDNLHFDSGENWSWGPAFDGVVRPWTSPVDTDGDGALEALVRPYSAVPNQLEEFFNIGNTVSNSISISGANDAFSYYASYSNTDQNGILDNTSYKRNTISLNASAKLTDRLSSDFKISYANIDQNTAQEGSRAFEGNNAYSMAVQSPVNIPFGELRDYNSPFHDINGYWGSYSSVNPYYILNEYGNEADINNFLGNTSLTYKLMDGLSVIGRFGANVVNTNFDTWTPSFTPETQLIWGDDFSLTTRNTRHSSVGDYTDFARQSTNLDMSAMLNYARNLTEDGMYTLDVTGGYNWFQREISEVQGSTNGGLVVPGWYNLSNSVQQSISSQYSEQYRIYGILGNARIGYKNALFLELSARNDWSSTLPSANNSFFYSAAGVSAVLSDLLEMDSDVLNFVKVRTSYGTSGKDAGLYLLESSFSGNPDLIDLGDNTINFPLNGQSGFTVSDQIGNPDLKPELTTTFEIGADLGFFDDRIGLSYTYYNAKHSDQIVVISLPESTGFDETSTNIGQMTNKGHELTLNLKPIVGMVSGLEWDLFATYAKNTNTVDKITDEIDELVVGGPYTPGVSIVAKEGLPFGTFKAQAPKTNAAGQVIVDANTGFPLYTDDEVYLGSYQPDYTMSVGSNINYKGIGLNVLFDVRSGGNFVSQTQFFTEFNGTAVHTTEHNREAYVFPNAVYEDADGNFVPNDIEITEQDYFTSYDPAASTYIVDASFVKLREIGLSYQLPSKIVKKTPFSQATVSLFAKNVKFWLPDENTFADPEINGPSLTGNATGVETTQTPPAKSLGLNLNITF